MDREIILAVAPTGGWGRRDNNPIKPDGISRDVIACAEAGPAVLRVGFEDSFNYNGKIATSNAELEAVVFSIASVQEARVLLLG